MVWVLVDIETTQLPSTSSGEQEIVVLALDVPGDFFGEEICGTFGPFRWFTTFARGLLLPLTEVGVNGVIVFLVGLATLVLVVVLAGLLIVVI